MGSLVRGIGKLRKQILSNRGVVVAKPPGKHTVLATIPTTNKDHLKTPHMRYLEVVHGKPIEKLLLSGSEAKVGELLDIDKSTVSRWIKRLKLRYTRDNLPDCTICTRAVPACLIGICVILVDLEQWDLVSLKEKEIMNDREVSNTRAE